MRCRLIRDFEKDRKIEQRRDPQNYVEDQRAEEFRKYYLPVADGNSGEGFNRAELKFLGEQTHRNQGKNQNKGKPEENRVKKCLLNGVLHLALIHERDLEIKIDPAHYQEKDEHDISDRGVEIAAYFAQKESVKFSHLKYWR